MYINTNLHECININLYLFIYNTCVYKFIQIIQIYTNMYLYTHPTASVCLGNPE